MQNTPLVSIIIPCYNCGNTIIEALQSALHQTYPHIEVIVVDDGSHDGSYDLVEEYIRELPNVKSFHQPNSGPSAARNQGVMQSNGEFLVFLDADDRLHEDYVQACVSVYEAQKDLQIVYADTDFFGIKTGTWRLGEFNISTILFQNTIPIYAMIRSDVFKAVGMFDENIKFAEDWELWIRILNQYGPRVYKIRRTLYYYRKTEDNTSLTAKQNDGEHWDNALLYIYQKHYRLYKEHRGSIFDLFKGRVYRHKYLNEWYRKLFYKLFKPRKYRSLYTFEKDRGSV